MHLGLRGKPWSGRLSQPRTALRGTIFPFKDDIDRRNMPVLYCTASFFHLYALLECEILKLPGVGPQAHCQHKYCHCNQKLYSYSDSKLDPRLECLFQNFSAQSISNSSFPESYSHQEEHLDFSRCC